MQAGHASPSVTGIVHLGRLGPGTVADGAFSGRVHRLVVIREQLALREVPVHHELGVRNGRQIWYSCWQILLFLSLLTIGQGNVCLLRTGCSLTPQGCSRCGEGGHSVEVGGSLLTPVSMDGRFCQVIDGFNEKGIHMLVHGNA